MKNLLSMAAFTAITFSFAACSNSAAEKGVALQAVPQQATVVAAQQATIDSMKIELARQRVVDSMQTLQAAAVANATQEAKAANQKAVVAKAPATRHRTKARRSRSTEASAVTYHSNAGYAATPAPVYQPAAVYEPAPAPAKKGWSAKAKGAVIGAGVGAAGGAIINKRNRGVGAIIGGLGGAAVGTGVGAIIDHKNGR